MACGLMIFTKNLKLKKDSVLFFFNLIFSCCYCVIDPKRQSKHSGLRFDTSGFAEFFQPVLNTWRKAYRESSEEIFLFQF